MKKKKNCIFENLTHFGSAYYDVDVSVLFNFSFSITHSSISSCSIHPSFHSESNLPSTYLNIIRNLDISISSLSLVSVRMRNPQINPIVASIFKWQTAIFAETRKIEISTSSSNLFPPFTGSLSFYDSTVSSSLSAGRKNESSKIFATLPALNGALLCWL